MVHCPHSKSNCLPRSIDWLIDWFLRFLSFFLLRLFFFTDRVPRRAIWRKRCRERELHYDLFKNGLEGNAKIDKRIFGHGEGGYVGGDVNAVCFSGDGKFFFSWLAFLSELRKRQCLFIFPFFYWHRQVFVHGRSRSSRDCVGSGEDEEISQPRHSHGRRGGQWVRCRHRWLLGHGLSDGSAYTRGKCCGWLLLIVFLPHLLWKTFSEVSPFSLGLGVVSS